MFFCKRYRQEILGVKFVRNQDGVLKNKRVDERGPKDCRTAIRRVCRRPFKRSAGLPARKQLFI